MPSKRMTYSLLSVAFGLMLGFMAANLRATAVRAFSSSARSHGFSAEALTTRDL